MLAVFLLPAVFAGFPQQQVPTRTLARPAVEYDEPFSSLRSLRELRDGRVIVSDIRDKTLQLIDLANGRATAIGREGSGPTEWGLPTNTLAMPGDSTYVADLLNSRFLVVGPDGRPVRTFSPAADAAMQSVTGRGGGAAGGRGGGATSFTIGGSSLVSARAADARGRMYYTGSPFVISADGQPSQADSVPILRQSPGSSLVDTVAYVRPAPNSATASGSRGGGNMMVRIGGGRPFESGDDWVVFPDGRVAIVRAVDYRVDIVQPNKQVVRGAAVRNTPVRVTDADKQQWREARQNAPPLAVTSTSGGGGAMQRSVQTGVAGAQEPDSWPDVKSPFGTGSVFAAPSGETWVFRQRAANDRVPVADVFNLRGQLVGRVALPAGTRVVALGSRGVYAVRTDEDDLQYLQRYAMTW